MTELLERKFHNLGYQDQKQAISKGVNHYVVIQIKVMNKGNSNHWITSLKINYVKAKEGKPRKKAIIKD